MSVLDQSSYKLILTDTGSDIDDLATKYNAVVDKLFSLMGAAYSWTASATEPTGSDAWAYRVWLDTHDPANVYLKIRNTDNTAWVSIFQLAVNGGITPARIGALKEAAGITAVRAGKDIDLPPVGNAGTLYIATDAGAIYYDNGGAWATLYKKNHTHNTVGDKPLDLSGLGDGQVLAWNATVGSFLPATNGQTAALTEQIDQIIMQLAALDITRVDSRVDLLERTVSDMALVLEAQSWMPENSAILLETFDEPADNIDKFSCNVISCMAGDDSLLVDSVLDILPGAYYTLTDGVSGELVQIKAINVSGSTKQVVLIKTIANMYQAGSLKLYRTTSFIGGSQAYGPDAAKPVTYEINNEFSPSSANSTVTIGLGTSVENSSQFTIIGDCTFTATGNFTLK